MSKPRAGAAPKRSPAGGAPPPSMLPAFLQGFGVQALLIALLAGGLYAMTINHEYALDDGIVIVKNQYVQEGVSGIGKILSRDTYDSYLRQMQARNQLTGGRYRPLSVVTFAIEQQFFGDAPHLRHLLNVLLFAATGVTLLLLLRRHLFPDRPDVAFLATLLFAIHPIHTEVVANIKSRDELLSLLFVLLTFLFAFRWLANRRRGTLATALVCYFLALLSKEWGVTLVALLPLALHVFSKRTPAQSLQRALPFAAVAAVFLVIRFGLIRSSGQVVDTEIMNNPYGLATATQALATKTVILLRYALLLVRPWPLVCDYSYNTIRYVDFTSPGVWASILFHLGLIAAGAVLLARRHPIGFAIMFYLGHLLVVSNLLFNIGAPMGDRLVYHASLGFCIAVAWLACRGLALVRQEHARTAVLSVALIPLVLTFGTQTVQRSRVWKNDATLFIHDAKYAPGSVIANIGAGTGFIGMFEARTSPADSAGRGALLDSAAFYLGRAIATYPEYHLGYVNLGLVRAHHGDIDSTEALWIQAEARFSRAYHPEFWAKYDRALSAAFRQRAGARAQQSDLPGALADLARAAKYTPEDAQLWYDQGSLHYALRHYPAAFECWEKTLRYDPNHADAKKGRDMVRGLIPRTN